MVAKTKGEVGLLKKKVLINLFFSDPGSRAVYVVDISRRMLRDGTTEFYEWIVKWYLDQLSDRDDTIAILEKQIAKLKSNQRLEREQSRADDIEETMRGPLTRFLESGCPFTDRQKEFMSERGDVLNKTWEQLTQKQKGFYKAISIAHNDWLTR